MDKCFNCGHKAVIWNGDFDFSDYGYDGEGIIHDCSCTHCGARITYEVPIQEKEEKQEENQIEGQTNIFDLIAEGGE